MKVVTQFEVHVYRKGHWSIHARYPGYGREDAVREAMATEFSAGCPTKVIRETYYPESNRAESVTTYVSPKTRLIRERRSLSKKAPPKSYDRSRRGYRRRATEQKKVKLSARDIFFRLIVAGGISLAATTLIMVVISWMLGRFVAAGIPLPTPVLTGILTYGYIATFLFVFMSLFRSRLPLHRLLAELWATANTATTQKKERSEMRAPKKRCARTMMRYATRSKPTKAAK